MTAQLMDVIVCTRPGELVAEQRPVPMPRDGEILVEVRRVGVCGTDMHIFRGKQPFLSYPRVMGHEFSGVVARPSSGSRLREGDPVFVMPYLSCGSCSACRKGKPNCCMRIEVMGVHRDGAMARYVAVPAEAVFPALALSLDDAAMIEFLAIGAHAVRRANVAPGQSVLVSGAGPIGIGCALFARLRGAEVTVVDPRADRLDVCRVDIGVRNVLVAGDGTRDELAALTSGDLFDVVFDATGSPQAMQAGFQYIGHGGTYVLVSVVSADITFSDPEFHKREATLMASRNATAEDFCFVRDCMLAGQVPTRALRTHAALLLDLPRSLPDWIRPESGVVKALVQC